MIEFFTGANHWLSNFSTEGAAKPSAEHQYQARKATNVVDAIWVMAAPTPGAAKRRGRRIACRPGWDMFKVQQMREVLWIKFMDPTLQQRLLETGNLPLIEGNHWGDTFWGVCNGVGENVLGQLLMEIRNDLRR